MKNFSLLCFLILLCISGKAQVTSLNETFDVTCAISGLNYPAGWSEYHKPTTNDLIAWNCSPIYGVSGSGCQQINGYYSATNHLDSAWLITPKLDLSGYSGDIYLQFQDIFRFNGDKVSLFVSSNYLGGYPDSSIYSWTNITDSLNPNFGTPDSLDWTTHRVKLTAFKLHSINFAFRYTSSLTACARWNVDNVMTTVPATSVELTQNQLQDIQVVSSPDKIDVSFINTSSNSCRLQLFDVVGKKYCDQTVQLQNGQQKISVDGMQLKQGMYFMRLSSSEHGVEQVVKVMIASGTISTKY